MTLYDLYLANDAWTGLEPVHVYTGDRMISIEALDIPDCTFVRCDVLHFKGNKVRINYDIAEGKDER